MGTMKSVIVSMIALATFAIPLQSSATLIGDEVSGVFNVGPDTTNYFDAGLGSLPVAATVGVGNEFFGDLLFGDVYVDLGANTLSFGVQNQGSYNLTPTGRMEVWLEDLDWVGHPGGYITGLNLISSDFTDLTYDFTDHGIHLSIGDQRYTRPDELWIANFAIVSDHAPIPEPTTVALLGLGLIGMVARHRVANRA